MPNFTQSGRPILIETTLPPDDVLLESFVLRDHVSTPFSLTCSLLSEKRNAPVADMLWKSVRIVQTGREGGKRYIHGLVRDVRHTGRTRLSEGSYFYHYEIEVAPRLWFLSLSQNCRIFQNKTIPQIVTEVLDAYPGLHYDLRLIENYAERVYCVQYRESDLAFISRLLEEEGIFYFFEHSDTRHMLVLADNAAGVKPLDEDESINFDPMPEAVVRPTVVTSFQNSSRVNTRSVALTDYDFEKPSISLYSFVGEESPQRFDYPGRYLTHDEGRRYTKLRIQEVEAGNVIMQGTSDRCGMAAGRKMLLSRHYIGDLNQKYFITAVEHRARESYYRSAGESPYEYENSFQAIPLKVPYRPPRVTPRAYVAGTQTAVVVGVEMDRPDTEEYGRVKVQFHWDRYGKRDRKSSCWIRVSQPWAGRGWGTVSIPRVGQEVIVDFLEGDPDRPLIVGRLYNRDMMPPFELPGGAVHMGFVSRSIGGTGYHQISADDTNLSEKISIHSQKDMDTVVENNETIHIKNCRSEKVGVDEDITIGNNRTENVGANEKITIGVNRSEQVGANENITIGANRTTTVGNNDVLTVSTTRTHSVGINEMINVGAAQQVSVGGVRLVTVGITNVSSAGMKQIVNAGNEIALNAPKINLKATEKLTLTCGGGTITIDAGGVITITGTMVKINS